MPFMQGKSKYVFKQRLFVSDLGVSEINEGGGDECKFAIWSSRSASLPDGKIVLKVSPIAYTYLIHTYISVYLCMRMIQ